MEKPFVQLSTESRVLVKVSPRVLREAADRLEAELKNNTLKNQEVVLKFSPSITFYMESEPEAKIYTSTASDEPMRSLKLPASLDTAETAPVLN